MLDVVMLSRIQFAFTAGFHYLFPPLSIGIALMIVIFEGMYVRTEKPLYKEVAQFWTRIFALTFAMGVATGLVQVFAFGNNWGRFSTFVGDVFGGLLAAEGIFAFFLEAGFIGVMLFGWDRVSKKVHYLSTILVTTGAHFSAIWIVAANSWMQTPAGFHIEGTGSKARAVIDSLWDVIFNPSFMDRITHVLLGAYLTGTFIVLSVAAYYFLKNRHTQFATVCMKVGLIVASCTLFLQLVSGDETARGVAQNQPAKLAAMEGVYTTQPYTPLTLFGVVDTKGEKVYGPQIPGLLSFLTYRSFETPITGLDQIPKDEWPPIQMVFQGYHLMILMWGLMVLAAIVGFIAYKKNRLSSSRWSMRFIVLSVLFPFAANEAGWFTAEVGRQPWVVWKVLRTTQGVSNSITSGQVIGSLIMFFCIYALLFALFVFLVNRKIQHGPVSEAQAKDDLIYRDPYLEGRQS